MKKEKSKSIFSIELYKTKPLLLNFNVIPFIVIYSLLLFRYYNEEVISVPTINNSTEPVITENITESVIIENSTLIDDINNPTNTTDNIKQENDIVELNVNLFLLGLTSCLFIVSHLFKYWSVEYKCFNSLKKVKSITDATLAKVTPPSHVGSKEIVQIHKSKNSSSELEYSILFQKRKFIYNMDKKQFEKVSFQVTKDIDQLLESKGYSTEKEIEIAKQTYGLNQFDIPIPTFSSLYKEQAIAPFFVFQVFCVLLWCLEDYLMYCLFTLFMLLVFEATIVQSRIKNLQTLREMSSKPSFTIYVYRLFTWKQVNSTELLPGDIVSIGRGQNEASSIIPCDLLLLNGGCVVNEAMLTGESTPHHKEPIKDRKSHSNDQIDLKNDKIHILYSGTQIVQHEPSEKLSKISRPPDKGCIACVIGTGFNTNQGRLMRTIWFSSERVTANNKESFLFILFLLAFAIAASIYLFINGVQDKKQSQYKLLLRCIMVITSVVPPELPMELSLAVNNSLISLIKLGIYCTEPFRIPFAGKIDVCCFDKTGTLTTDDLFLQGIAFCPTQYLNTEKEDQDQPNDTTGSSSNSTNNNNNQFKLIANNNNDKDLINPSLLNLQIQYILAGCHSLVLLDNKLVGDPMETASLKSIPWTFKGDKTVHQRKPINVEIIQRYHFSSALKRMSTICQVTQNGSVSNYSFTKGAPEIIKPFFSSLPDNYDKLFMKYSKQGSRVIALGFKKLSLSLNSSQLKSISRESAESDLQFAGFLVFDCPLKPDSKQLIDMLQFSDHRIVMITGDNSLTACHVAKQLGFMTQPNGTLILSKPEKSTDNSAIWTHIEDDDLQIPFDSNNENHLVQLNKDYNLCVSGSTLELISESATLSKSLYLVKVFARVSPDQKQIVLSNLKHNGFHTLMAGDGTNDVGALKQAHVGVAILNRGDYKPMPELPSITQLLKQQAEMQRQQRMRRLQGQNALNQPLANNNLSANAGAANLSNQMKKMQEDMDVPMVKLGDASIAAPFTSKSTAVIPVTHIIRQGRCTLVTTFQMYKILALNSLITAYSLSALYIDGVKLGDSQATIAGMLIACCFLFISTSKPLPHLANRRPSSNLFSPYMLSSILLQFLLHLGCLIFIKNQADMRSSTNPVPEDPDSPFTPNLLNTAVFLMSNAMQVATFAVNYKGHPFMQSLRENKPLLYALSAVWGLGLILSLEISPSLNEFLELVPFPDSTFQIYMVSAIIIDLVGAWLIDNFLNLIFNSTPKKQK